MSNPPYGATAQTTHGVLPVFVLGSKNPGLSVLEDPQVGDIAATWTRGRYRAVSVIKVGPKNVQVAYTTQGALDEAERIAQFNNAADVIQSQQRARESSIRYRRLADLVEQLGMEPTEGRQYPESSFVPLSSLPAEYAKLDAESGTNGARSTIVWKPETLRKWADDSEAYANDDAKLYEAQATDALPFAEKMVKYTHVTTKTVKRTELYNL